MQENGWIIAITALAVSIWNAWNSWRKDVSTFVVRVKQPPSYRPRDGVLVTAVHRRGPPLKIISARARVVRVRGIRWFEAKPEQPETAILRSENREVEIRLDAEYRRYFWYIDVLAEAGISKRQYLRRLPPVWLPKLELGTFTLAQVGAIAIPGRLEKSLDAMVREARKEANREKIDDA